MRSVLAMGGYLAATVGATCALLGRWIPRPQTAAPGGWLGIIQAFHPCPRCDSPQPHIVHSTAARTCQSCGHHTHPRSHQVIDNTSRAMATPATRDAFLIDSLLNGSNHAIQQQEKAGQQQLLHSDRLPVDTGDTDPDFEALGFTFGAPDSADPLFRPADLPEGWTRQAADHDMWSYIVDQHGRRRVAVFYKAAFYDRKARMHLMSVDQYVTERQAEGAPIITDDTWATREAITAAIRRKLEDIASSVTTWSAVRPGQAAVSAYAATRLEELSEERIAFTAMLADFETASL